MQVNMVQLQRKQLIAESFIIIANFQLFYIKTDLLKLDYSHHVQ